MKQIRITFSIKYDRCELSETEHKPEIYAFLDARFKRSQRTLKFTPDENDPNKVYHGEVTGYINERVGGIPPTASLVFTHYSWRPNQWGSPELQGNGSNHITFGELLKHNGKAEKFSKELPLLMHTVNNLEKGQIQFTLHSIDLGGAEMVKPIFISRYAGEQYKVDQVVNALKSYTNTVMGIETSMKDAYNGIDRMRMPYNLSESGLEMTSGLPLPAYSYVLSEIPESNTRFWENAFEQVMKRDGLLASDFFSLNNNGKARVMANMITYMPTMLDYVSDTVMTDNRLKRGKHRVESQGIELFGNSIGPALGGDCKFFFFLSFIKTYVSLRDRRGFGNRNPTMS
jgi:hypothetical protein